jgi:opine dehydrogenase
MQVKKIAVVGAGNGGVASAGDFAIRGFEVNLFEFPEFKASLDPIIESGKTIELFGAISGKGKLNYVGTDIAQAIKNVDVIAVVVPSMGHAKMATLIAPHIKDGQIVYVNPGSTFGGLEFVKIFKDMKVKGKIPIAETSTLTYGARRVPGQSKARITVQSKKVYEGIFPAKYTEEITKALKNVYPDNIPAQNLLESSLNNMNPSLHSAPTIMTASTIERTGKFNLYRDGISPSVCKVIEAVDNERLAMCRKLGFREWPLAEQTSAHGYSPEGKPLYETLHSEIFESVIDTMDLHHRFLLDDVQYGVVSFASLGEQLGIPMSTCRAIIELTSKLHGVDYWKEGKRNMKYLGLDHMNKDDLFKFLFSGL